MGMQRNVFSSRYELAKLITILHQRAALETCYVRLDTTLIIKTKTKKEYDCENGK